MSFRPTYDQSVRQERIDDEPPAHMEKDDMGGDVSNEIPQFFERMARALVAGDGRTVASMWGVPALVVSDPNVMSLNDLSQVEQFFAGAKDQYAALGITDTRPEIVRLDQPTERLVIVQVRWPYLDADGKTHGSETSTYVLRRDEQDNWKQHVALMHGATT